jgi:hypothetical protein
MGLKKYEIITVGSDRRVRALRSWQVGDRYVNIGDVGGIVYDEKTLSQDGACWLFRGNFGFPGARIGGDSIVDVGEAALSTAGTPAVDILGSSVVVGSAIRFSVISGAADAAVLRPTDFEEGTFNYAAGSNWETWKQPSPNYLRTKAPIFNGGVSTTVLKLEVPGYAVQAYVLDRDGKGVTATASTNTGVGVTLAIPAGQYFLIRLSKNPAATISLSDVTTAAITYTAIYDGKLVINDSRLEINPATGTGTLTLRPGGTYSVAVGSNYPDSVIQNSKVSITSHATANRTITLMSEVIDTNAIIDASVESASIIVGVYNNVKNLAFSGSVTGSYDINIRGAIRATDCDNFTVSPTIFPALSAAQTANMPFIFQGCNVPGGLFYHHTQIANTYKNIDFAKASVDLGKAVPGDGSLVSSEVEGMYRVAAPASGVIGGLVESYESVRSLLMASTATSYGTTIYKDAYFNGRFDFAGTNVFGSKSPSHPLAQDLNIQPRAVQGNFNTATLGQTVTGVIPSDSRVCTPTPFRINGANGLKIEGLSATLEALVIFVTPSNVVTAVASSSNGVLPFPAARLNDYAAYVRFGKIGGTAITPADLAGVTVTVYNGCKIVNTGATAVNMKGNIRVEDNATLINSSITGTGYFGGNAVASGLYTSGCVFMKDNASFTKTAGSDPIRDLKMTENAYAVLGDVALNGCIHLSDNARFTPTSAGLSEGDLVMKDNAVVSGAVILGGVLTMKDNAKVSAGALSTYGDITLCGSYNQTTNKSWTGKRVIDNENAPEYDNNVKTQYDF